MVLAETRGLHLSSVIRVPVYGSEQDALWISENIQALHMPYNVIIDPVFASPTSADVVSYSRGGNASRIYQQGKTEIHVGVWVVLLRESWYLALLPHWVFVSRSRAEFLQQILIPSALNLDASPT